jgi:iron complex transport system substrate-binding protein
MIKKYIFLIPCILVFLQSCGGKENINPGIISITDDLGNIISFDKTPKRIITLAPNLTETIFELGLDKYLVGNTVYCDYPEQAKKIEKVGNLLTFNYEKIVTLKPDIIFITVEGNTKDTFDKFHELGLKIFVSNPRNYAGIKKTFNDFGKIFGIEKLVDSKIAKWDSVINNIKTIAKKYPEKPAMSIVEIHPIMIAGKNTFINEYLQICGLKNIAEDSPMNYPTFSREEILKRNPDYIIFPTGGDDNLLTVKNAYPEWAKLNAIKNNHVLFVDRNLYSRPGPRFVEAVTDLFNRLHSEEFLLPNHPQ